MKLNTDSLKAKGWSDYEINHVMDVLRKAEEEKHPKIKLLDENLYWLFLFLAIVGNIAFSIALLPVMVMFPNTMLYAIVGFTAVIFGTLCATLLRTIDKIDFKHHILYVVLIPIAGLVNFTIILNQANHAVETLGMGATHNPWILGLVYLALFFLPYALFYRRDDWEWT